MMKKLMKRQRGFTLVELLIVMIIIGILAGGMMMVMGSSTDKADATKALSDLRTMASATMQYYADKGGQATLPTVDDLSKMMNKVLGGSYDIVASGEQTWVGVEVPTAGSRARLADTRAQERLVIVGAATKGTLGSLDFAATHPWAYMRAK